MSQRANPTGPIARIKRDATKLMERAAEHPGIAEVLAFHERYSAVLEDIQRQLTVPPSVSITASDSTG